MFRKSHDVQKIDFYLQNLLFQALLESKSKVFTCQDEYEARNYLEVPEKEQGMHFYKI